MRHPLRSWLLAFALLFAQCAAQAHAVSHIDPAVAGSAGHPVEHCVAFHGIDSVLPSVAFTADPVRADDAPAADLVLPLERAPRIDLRSRGPPPVA